MAHLIFGRENSSLIFVFSRFFFCVIFVYNSIVLLFFIFNLVSCFLLSVESWLLPSVCIVLWSKQRRCSLFNNVPSAVSRFVFVYVRDAFGARKQPLLYYKMPCGSNLKTQSTTSNNSFKKIKYQIVRAQWRIASNVFLSLCVCILLSSRIIIVVVAKRVKISTHKLTELHDCSAHVRTDTLHSHILVEFQCASERARIHFRRWWDGNSRKLSAFITRLHLVSMTTAFPTPIKLQRLIFCFFFPIAQSFIDFKLHFSVFY